MTDQVIIYQSEDGRTRLDVRLEDETVWLSQEQLTELFGKAKGTISEHIEHIFFRRAEDSRLESDFDRAAKELPTPKKDEA